MSRLTELCRLNKNIIALSKSAFSRVLRSRITVSLTFGQLSPQKISHPGQGAMQAA